MNTALIIVGVLVGGSGLLLVAYQLLLWRDLNHLERFCAAPSRDLKDRLEVSPTWTAWGRRLWMACAGLRTQAATVSWELQARNLRELYIPDLEETGNDRAPRSSAQAVREAMEKVHHFIEREFRSSEELSVVKVGDGNLELIGTPLPSRLQQAVLARLEESIRRSENSFAFVQHALEAVSPLAVMRSFGIEQSLFCVFSVAGKVPVRGGFWLGYTRQRGVSELERTALQELSRKVARYFSTLSEVLVLTDEVYKAHDESVQKSAFIAHMSHDIRSPLNNIKAILTLFRLESTNPEWIELSEAAMRNCDGLGEIVEDLLDYSRHQAGKLVARPEVVDIGMCAEDVVTGFGVTARLKGINLRVERSDPPSYCRVDKRQLRRVLSNLLNNALKYTNAGEVVLGLRERDTQLRIEVRDSGVGMTQSQLKALFTPFTRFQAGGDGVGLGLVVTKILIGLNGGNLEVRSEEGRGTCCEIVLPLCPAEVSSSLCRSDSGVALQHKRILLLDDDRGCVDSLARLLEREGFVVARCYSLEEGIKRMTSEVPDVLLTDLHMPGGSGQLILHVAAAMQPPPLMAVLSGDDLDPGAIPGVARCFRKPVVLEELLGWLRGLAPKGKEALAA